MRAALMRLEKDKYVIEAGWRPDPANQERACLESSHCLNRQLSQYTRIEYLKPI